MLHLDHGDVAPLLDRVGERERSRGNRCKDRRVTIERLIHHISKNWRLEFHWSDFVDHDKFPCTQGSAQCFDADALQPRQVESIFSDALSCFEIDMRKYSFFIVERNDLEPNALPALANIDPPRMFQFQVRFVF